MGIELQEIDTKNEIQLTGYNFLCDDIISDSIPYPLPNKTFKIALIGKSGSGKTNLLRNLTEKLGKNSIYARKFSNVFYISPSIKSMDKKPKLPQDRFYSSLKDLPEIVNRMATEENKEVIRKKQLEKIKCECGALISRSNISIQKKL